jgi:hypothetical protein
MDEVESQLKDCLEALREEVAITNSNQTRKEMFNLLYARSVYSIEKTKAYLRAYAHIIQKYYNPSDKKAILAVRITKRGARGIFKILQKQLAQLNELSDIMDYQVFTLED